jgi:RNA polymerase sigma-70 factor (ECF subfamily)
MEPLASPVVDEISIDSFVREHYPRLIRLAGLICRRTSDAEDAVQAGLERAWRNHEALRDAERLRPWLDRIVVREALRGSRRRLFPIGDLASVTVGEIVVADGRPDAMTDWTAVRIEFERLTPEHRAVISLHLYAGYSVAETAEILSLPVETARSRLRVAKAALRGRLKDSGS